jgi:LSD1 subclass zinc finger protein
MNPAAPNASYINCIGCNTLLSHPPTSLTIQCPKVS